MSASHLQKATAHFEKKEYSLAARSFADALELEDSNADARRGIARVNAEIEQDVQQYLGTIRTDRTAGKPKIPDGAWVTMITPFTAENKIDWVGVDHLVEWYIESGIAGIFAVCQSSEMYFLNDEERLILAKRVVEVANGRVPVVASGTLHKTIEEQAEFSKKMYSTGIEAVVIIASMMCEEKDDESVWKANVQKLLDLTGNIPMSLYECPKPYHRLLTPETIRWAAQTGRIYLHKDTCCSIPGIKAKLDAIKTLENSVFKFFNANIETLLVSVQMGANGFCGIAANCYPGVISWMLGNHKEHPTSAENVQKFLTIGEPTIALKYPQSAKIFLRMGQAGFKYVEPLCRTCNHTFLEVEIVRILHLRDAVKYVSQEIEKNKTQKA